ncbi:hypothetical protein [Labrenzia sp. DG1229]|uniref:hypothetical protein n=1 Tax=Labrenzia sp. DG1229 TaxID=681847 RepID=UPI000B0AFAC8|nr:hypothetical protein [Labrenzia sp. DG1229]
MADLLSRMTLTRWIAFVVVLAVVAFVLLTQFTSFQIPKTLTQHKSEPQVGGGLELQGSTHAPTNLDAVREILDDRASGGGAAANQEGASND